MNKIFIGREEWECLSFSDDDVKAFSLLSGDINPIHLDENYAANTRFKSRIVHGILATSVFSKIIGTKMPGLGSIYLEQNVKFVKPIYIDQEINAVVKIVDINEEKNIISLETNVFNKDKTEYLIRGTARVLFED